jgi:long-chain fatty acid transport protein
VLVGDRLDVGIAIFSPRRSYNATDSPINGQFGAFTINADDVESGSEYFPIPYIGKSWALEKAPCPNFGRQLLAPLRQRAT